MSGKKLLARTNRFLEPSPPHTVISSHFWGGKDDIRTEQRVAGEFLCQQFSLREQIPPATRVCFGSSISPPEKARIFSYNVCTATFLCYLLGLLGQATDTKPQEIQVQQRSGICLPRPWDPTSKDFTRISNLFGFQSQLGYLQKLRLSGFGLV